MSGRVNLALDSFSYVPFVHERVVHNRKCRGDLFVLRSIRPKSDFEGIHVRTASISEGTHCIDHESFIFVFLVPVAYLPFFQ